MDLQARWPALLKEMPKLPKIKDFNHFY